MTIAIIGGGFSGVCVAVQLARQAKKNIQIVLFNAGYPFAAGVAYSTVHPMHVLNVPAGRMSFFLDEPNHFTRWIKGKYKDEFLHFGDLQLEDAFLPRAVYAKYINDVFVTEMMTSRCTDYLLVSETAVNISHASGKMEMKTQSGRTLPCDAVVLATGNELPATPVFISKEMAEKEIYISNPWYFKMHKNYELSQTILLLGTGLTMIDNMLSILSSGFKGKMVAVSTKGLLPLPFRKSETDYGILEELKRPYIINTVFDIFRKHVHRVRNYGLSGTAVVDALRPLTQDIWKELSVDDKKRFLVHIRQLWGVARHRLPLHIFDLMNGYIQSKRVEIIAGRLINVTVQNNTAEATIALRATGKRVSIPVQKIINCTGPLLDITKSKSKLFQNLIKDGLLCADELKLGIKATADYAVVNASGNEVENMFVIGPMLKGTLWETTAVPEIRKQAEEVAYKILN